MRRILPGLALCALLAGCRCRSEREPSPTLGHYIEWEALVDATAAGDLRKTKVIAGDLTGGPPGDAPTGAADAANSKLGAALGFYGFAEDHEEAADALVSAARGCGLCHAEAAAPPPSPDWSHHGGARWVVDGLVWNRSKAPPGGDPPLDALSEAWSAPIPADTGIAPSDDEIRAARVVAACAGCHG